MKITDTLDQLLRALLSASEDEARESGSTPGDGAESSQAGTPIRSAVPAWDATNDAKPGDGESSTGTPGGLGPRFTTAEATTAAPGEHVLPEWVRRSQERAAAPAEPETVTVTVEEAVATVVADEAPPVEEEPAHVEAVAIAAPDVAPVEPVADAVEEPVSGEAELSVVSEVAPVEAEVEVAAPVEDDPWVMPPSAPVEQDEVQVAEQAAALDPEVLAGSDVAAVETDPFATAEHDVPDVEAAVEESTAVEHPEEPEPLAAFDMPGELEAFDVDEESAVETDEGGEVVASTEVEPAAELEELEGGDVPAVLPLTGADLARLETASRLAESLNLGFHLGLAVERIAAAATQGSAGAPALREATWLIERYVALLEQRPIGADIHMSAARLARTGDAIAGMRAIAAALDAASAPSEPPSAEEPPAEADRPADEAERETGAVEAEPATD